VKEYVDEALSGKTTDRPAFREMIAAARRSQKPFDLILVWKFSRFARNREDSIVFKTMLRKHGIRVISINEPSEDAPTEQLLEAMIESLDEFYSANLGEEVTRGIRESSSRGFYISARALYGYRKIKVKEGVKEGTRLEIKENEAPIVGRIFAEALRGKGSAMLTPQEGSQQLPVERLSALRPLWQSFDRSGGQEREIQLLCLRHPDQKRGFILPGPLPYQPPV
jgi:site-specific DNA recombinase